MSIIQVQNLVKSYKKGFIPKKQTVLKGVSFTLQPSTITGFLGGNGAGKTTTMKCILGLAFPDSGQINYFNGQSLTSETKSRIGFLPERPYFYDYLTGEEFLKFYGDISGKFKKRLDLKQRIDFLLKKVDLYDSKNKTLREYSKGMLQKIGIAQALVHRPEFIVLDEPMAGLDPDGRYYLSELINETAREGTAIFFSSHLLYDTEKLCENLVILKDGVVIFEGKTEQLISKMNSQLKITYQKAGAKNIEMVKAGAELTIKLSALLKEKFEILSVEPELISLEQAFISMAMKGAKS